MKKTATISAIAVLAAVACGPKDNTLTKAEIADGSGYIITRKKYADFELIEL